MQKMVPTSQFLRAIIEALHILQQIAFDEFLTTELNRLTIMSSTIGQMFRFG